MPEDNPNIFVNYYYKRLDLCIALYCVVNKEVRKLHNIKSDCSK